MRKCCIKGCSSSEKDFERNFFEINDARKEWINIIKQSQPLDETRRMFVCDLHFNSNQIQRHNTRTILLKNAIPIIGPHTEATADCNDNEFLGSFSMNYEDLEMEPQWKTISMEEYKRLVQLIPDVEKYRNSAEQKEKIIKSKDSQLKELQRSLKRNWINVSHLSDEVREVIECLINGNTHKKYSENVRRFCMRQQYYSTAAYQSLRLFFNKNIPAMRTLQLWYKSIDASPGICTASIDIIREKAKSYLEENGHQLHLGLQWDEVHVRKGLFYCNEKQSFVGFSSYINTSNDGADESLPKIAKEALVYMVVGTDFKIPVGYELVSGLNGIDRAALILQVIREIEAAGVKIISLTGDGLAANIVAYEKLGVRFDLNQPYFQSPTYPDQKIYIIFDACHGLKLIRKHFSLDKIYYNGQLINWNFVDILENKQSLDNFSLCNKLTRHHINWHQKPMNVRLAAETISNSVANALEQLCKDGYDDFKDCEATVQFLRMFNNAFDILNVMHGKEDGKYRQRICSDTVKHIFEFAESFQQYIHQLEYRTATTSTPILQSPVYLGFFGFYYNFSSIKGIYEDFILNGPLNELYTMQLSQDHLETFFSLIRNCLGRNDNPNAIEFRSAFRKLLICHPVLTSHDHNVITNATGILTVSSKIQKSSSPSTVRNQTQTFESERGLEIDMELLSYESVMLNEIELMEPYEQHMCAYIASCIEKKFIENTNLSKYKCEHCANLLLFSNDSINDGLLAMKDGEIKQPSASTLKIVIFSNAAMKLISLENPLGNDINDVCRVICENIDMDDLFDDIDFNHDDQEHSASHKSNFITLLIKIYLNLKSQRIGKKITDNERGELIRYNKKRSVIVAGQ